MKTNAVDLRHNLKDIMSAVERNESVTLLYRGKEKAVIQPIQQKQTKSVKEHLFFGMLDDDVPVDKVIDDLRDGRY